MSRAARLSNYEIRAEGWRALTERLGVSGAIRFLMEYDPGRGDYVEERREFLKLLGKAKRNIRIEGSFYVCKQTDTGQCLRSRRLRLSCNPISAAATDTQSDGEQASGE